MILLNDAIYSLHPNAKYILKGTDYDGLEWISDDIPKPSRKILENEMARLQAEYNTKEYQRNRAPEYPPIGDQLDDLFHSGAFSPEMAAKIQAIKDKYPKG